MHRRSWTANNRDLATFTTDLATTERLATLVPPACVLVGESGIKQILGQ